MDPLKLPDMLAGSWEHLLIATYGADLPFFENAIWRQLSSSCRNRIILADGRLFLDECERYAEGNTVRYLNQRYVAEGIHTPQSAHAKFILLTNSERGRLLVGSGNLSLGGYAGGGELFTVYEYSPDDTSSLGAFVTVRQLVEDLIDSGYVAGTATDHVQTLLQGTPWMFHTSNDVSRPVRHNLNRSFLRQLVDAVSGESVEELWILSPFYDEQCVALRELVNALEPTQTTLLVQQERTHVDLDALQRVCDMFSGNIQVRTFDKDSDTIYVHAKLYLLKLADRALCLQGSPNLSQVAMLLTVPQGNVELGNLIEGQRDAFDGILSALNIGSRVRNLQELNLEFRKSDDEDPVTPQSRQILGGELRGNTIAIRTDESIVEAELPGVALSIGGVEVPVTIRRRDATHIEITLSAESAKLLDRAVPVVLHFADGRQTNPVYICNRPALDAMLEQSNLDEVLRHVGDLDLGDDEFQQLFNELAETILVVDGRTIWRLAGRDVLAIADDEDDDESYIRYEDVDYEQLRRHPRLRQYAQASENGSLLPRTQLQAVLDAITNHFHGLLEQPPTNSTTATHSETSLAETEEEREVRRARGRASTAYLRAASPSHREKLHPAIPPWTAEPRFPKGGRQRGHLQQRRGVRSHSLAIPRSR